MASLPMPRRCAPCQSITDFMCGSLLSCIYSTLLLPCHTAVRPHLLLATEAKNNCTYAFLPEKQFGN